MLHITVEQKKCALEAAGDTATLLSEMTVAVINLLFSITQEAKTDEEKTRLIEMFIKCVDKYARKKMLGEGEKNGG